MLIPRWLRRASVPFGAALLLAGCEFTGPQSTLDPAGPVAQAQADLLMWSFWLSLFVMFATFGILAYVMVRFRRSGKGDEIPEQFHGSAPLEIGLTIVPVLIVIAIAVPTVRTIFATENRITPQADDLIVNVTGYQWWWRFEYPELGVVTANELHIPTDTRIILNLDSADVLHSFWVPRLAGKRDLIPNQNNQLWFETPEEGAYYGQCAELCLGAHAYMKFRVIAESEDAFEAWVDDFSEGATQAVSSDPQVQQGYQLFATKGCTNCHAIQGYRQVPVGTPDFPNLTNFGLRTTLAAGVVENNRANLEAWLRDPQEIKPGNYMPQLWAEDDPNADAEIAAVAAYLLSLGTDGPQAHAAALGGHDGDR